MQTATSEVKPASARYCRAGHTEQECTNFAIRHGWYWTREVGWWNTNPKERERPTADRIWPPCCH